MNASMTIFDIDSIDYVHNSFPSFYGFDKHVWQRRNSSFGGRLCEEKVNLNDSIDSRTIRDPFSLTDFLFVVLFSYLNGQEDEKICGENGLHTDTHRLQLKTFVISQMCSNLLKRSQSAKVPDMKKANGETLVKTKTVSEFVSKNLST